MKLLRRIANLGYGSRKEVTGMFREGRITHANGDVLYADDSLDEHARHEEVRVDGERWIHHGLLLMLNKPVGFTCSKKDKGQVVYELLPPRFALRDPAVSTVGEAGSRHQWPAAADR